MRATFPLYVLPFLLACVSEVDPSSTKPAGLYTPDGTFFEAPWPSDGRLTASGAPRWSDFDNVTGLALMDELIAMVDHGYVAEWASGGMEDPKGMRLTASTHYLREIRNGVLTGRLFVGPLGGHVDLAGPVPMILKSLVAKSKTTEGAVPKLHLGGCMKYHKEYVPAGIGGPWVLWSGIQCG